MAKVKAISKFLNELDEMERIDVIKYSSEDLNELINKLSKVHSNLKTDIKNVEYLKELKALKEKYNIKD